MTNNHTATPIPKDSVQEEEQLMEMLSRLNQVHLQVSLLKLAVRHSVNRARFLTFAVQLRELRSTIPRMLAPLMDKQPSRT
jgi:hypothetical protein